MPRKKTKSLQRPVNPDRVYKSVLVQRLINKSMLDGKKTLAEAAVYKAMELAAKETKKEAIDTLETAIKNITPLLEVKSRRIGGASYQIPFEVRGTRQIHLALMWLVTITRSKKGKPFARKLADEIIAAHNNSGDAVKKREDTHRMAEANRAFAHLGRF